MKAASWFKGIRLSRPPAAGPPKELPAPDKVYVALRQHLGPVCEPRVAVGDAVGLGQVIGSSEEFETAQVHATVSGTVEAIIDRADPSGDPVPTVVIANDGKDAWVEGLEAGDMARLIETLPKTRPTRLVKAIRNAGLVRAASQGLPLHVDLSPPMAPRSYLFMTGIPVMRPVDTLVIKAVDSDPPVCPNSAALYEAGPALELGVMALARISGAEKVIVVTPKGSIPQPLADMAQRHEWQITQICQTHFPYATDKLLVNSLTGREVPTPYGEPRDVGVVVEPLPTALDVGNVLISGRPGIERIFAVAGDVMTPGVFRVRLGTPVGKVIEAAGGLKGEAGKVIVGGPMLGLAHYDLNTPVTKETGGVFVQSKDKLVKFKEHPCIHCGRCVAACPVNLLPNELGKLCEYQQFDDAEERDLMHCIECGVCAYVCPAKRPMVQYLRHGKSEVMARRMES